MACCAAVARYRCVGLGMPPDLSDGWTFASLLLTFTSFIFGTENWLAELS